MKSRPAAVALCTTTTIVQTIKEEKLQSCSAITMSWQVNIWEGQNKKWNNRVIWAKLWILLHDIQNPHLSCKEIESKSIKPGRISVLSLVDMKFMILLFLFQSSVCVCVGLWGRRRVLAVCKLMITFYWQWVPQKPFVGRKKQNNGGAVVHNLSSIFEDLSGILALFGQTGSIKKWRGIQPD